MNKHEASSKRRDGCQTTKYKCFYSILNFLTGQLIQLLAVESSHEEDKTGR
jgi:hypothetical protein